MTAVHSGRTASTSPPSTSATLDWLHHQLGAAARRGAGPAAQLDECDVDAIVDVTVGMLAEDSSDGGCAAVAAAAAAGQAAAAMGQLALPPVAHEPVDWSGFGALLPVLSGSPGAGASVCAAALTDALQRAGRCVLLVDAADPARSGLAGAASVEGPWTTGPHQGLRIRYSWRDQAVLARLESDLALISPGMLPPPPVWLPPLSPLHVTVVDIGHDGWRAAANPLAGAGGWLRAGLPASAPLLVVRPTRPSLRHAEQVLARLDRWVGEGIARRPAQLMVNGARRWPAGVTGAAGHRLAPLVDAALFVPHDPAVQVGGVTDEPLPAHLLDALIPLLAHWGLLPTAAGHSRRGRR